MDLVEIKRLAQAAREFTTEMGGDNRRIARLRVPSQHESSVVAARAGVGSILDDKAAVLVLQRALLEQALVGWQGVRVGDVLPGAAPEDEGQLLPWAADAVPLLLDAQPDWAKDLTAQLMARLTARHQVRDTAEKNSRP